MLVDNIYLFFLLCVLFSRYFSFPFIQLHVIIFLDPLKALEANKNRNVRTFIEIQKKRVDNDNHAPPFDDLRNYAYEGDGSNVGSLSSLASGRLSSIKE